MEKLTKIFHKLKTTEINLKSINLKNINLKNINLDSVKNKLKKEEGLTSKQNSSQPKFSIKDLKNISISDLRKFDYKNFYLQYKQQILTGFVVFMGVFFLFYWTNAFLQSKLNDAVSDSEKTYKKLENVANMAGQIQFAKTKGVNAMTQNLLVFIQNTGSEIGIPDKMVNLRPVTASKGIEHISLRMENLYYDELIKFIKEIEKYDNLSIKVINFNKRYDNPKKIDTSIEVVKM